MTNIVSVSSGPHVLMTSIRKRCLRHEQNMASFAHCCRQRSVACGSWCSSERSFSRRRTAVGLMFWRTPPWWDAGYRGQICALWKGHGSNIFPTARHACTYHAMVPEVGVGSISHPQLDTFGHSPANTRVPNIHRRTYVDKIPQAAARGRLHWLSLSCALKYPDRIKTAFP